MTGSWQIMGKPLSKTRFKGTITTKIIIIIIIIISGRTIKRKLEHLVEVRPTRPVRTAFEIIDYFKCEI